MIIHLNDYLLNPGECPKCSSREDVSVSISTTHMTRDLTCKKCGITWCEVYTITNVYEIVGK